MNLRSLCCFLLLVNVTVLTRGTAVGVEDAGREVRACLLAYRQGLQTGELAAVLEMTVSVLTAPEFAVNEKLQRLSDGIRSGNVYLWIFPSTLTVIDDCALIVISDQKDPVPDDPAYLLKRDGKWKVMLGITSWDEYELGLSDEQKARFTELKARWKKMKRELRSTPRDKLAVE